jgi:hypothetical protein
MNKSQKMAELARSNGAVPSTDSQKAVKPEIQQDVKLSSPRRQRRSVAGLNR